MSLFASQLSICGLRDLVRLRLITENMLFAGKLVSSNMEPKRPAVSVAATVLNEREDIDSLVATLSAQTLPPAEVIIVDGGSTDGTWERLESARAQHPNLVPIRDPSCSLKNSASWGKRAGLRSAFTAVR